MDRRRFLKGGAASLVAAAAVGTGSANHISEPLRPIESISTDIYRYPDGDKIAVDGTGVVDWQNAGIRFETRLVHKADWPDRQAPSEHWRLDVEYWVPDPDGKTRLVRDWYGFWAHQNTVPHLSGGSMEIYQLNQTRADLVKGTPHPNWATKRLWTVRVKGLESGVVLSQDIPFTVVIP